MFRSRVLFSGILLTGLGLTAMVFASDRSEFEKWMNQETQSYQEYKDKRDKEFTSFLKSQWKEMQTYQGLVRDKSPKPVVMPVAPQPVVEPPRPIVKTVPRKPDDIRKPLFDKKPELKVPAVAVVKVPPIQPPPPSIVIKPVPVVQLPKGRMLEINFYGHNLKFTYDPKLRQNLANKIDEKAMSSYWSELSKADYDSLLQQINAQHGPLNLNDWGYALLINKISKAINSSRSNEQALFTWFMLIKASYQARIAYDSRQVFLLLPSRQQLFGAPYFTFEKVRYYALGFDGEKQKPGRVFTYDGQYPGATHKMDMSLSSAINTARKQKNKDLSFKFNDKLYRIRAEYDDQTVAFLNTYPQMDIGMYFDAKVNQSTASPLLKQLKPLVEGKSEQEAVNLLLRFVQTSFKYKTDEVQFGIENYLFMEETLFYPYSDCEDRSIFFAWLVHNLLGLEVVGLDFPGHIAAAVNFNEAVPGDAFRSNGKRYVVTDPTYVNANAGMTMPDYKNKKPNIIRISF